MIPYGRQHITQDDIDAVTAVLKSDFLTQGPALPDFEKIIAQHCNSKFCFATNSATSALHIACLALDLGPNDWLWTSPVTFVASANCGIYCGAKVDFVDIEAGSFNMCPVALEKKLEIAAHENRLPKIVIPVHLAGQPCDMQAIHKLSLKYGFKIIEDASHAIGGKYSLDTPIGNCQFSDITVFSFHPVKIITTGEGGMAVTNDEELAKEMQLLRSHGVTRDPDQLTSASHGAWYYQQLTLGYNYRMTDIQAALGASQMNRLTDYISQRQKLVDVYDKELDGLPIKTQLRQSGTSSAHHLYIICLELEQLSKSHVEIFDAFRQEEILVNLHYIPVHLQPFYQKMGFNEGDFPQAENYYARAISLPLFPTMYVADQEKVIRVAHEIIS